jgi:hypothetical protein
MTRREFEAWCDFYDEEPFDDLHRYFRPAALVAKSMGGADIQALVDWLQPPPEGFEGEFSVADLRTIASLGGVPPKKENE